MGFLTLVTVAYVEVVKVDIAKASRLNRFLRLVGGLIAAERAYRDGERADDLTDREFAELEELYKEFKHIY